MPLLSTANAEITVGGLINTDTVWNRGNTYVLTGSIQIPSGVTLTIEPGVTVHLALQGIEVNGVLKVQGSSTNPVTFINSNANIYSGFAPSIKFMQSSVSWNDLTASGCIIQNTRFVTASITMGNCSPKIVNNNLNMTTISVSGGSPKIENNEIYGPVSGYSLTIESGSAIIANNYIHDTSGIYAKGNSNVYNNKVDHCWNGIRAADQATIKGNTVVNSKSGRGIVGDTNGVTITQNYVSNNGYGFIGVGTLESNTIISNNVGIQITTANASTQIQGNNIYNNSQSNLVLTTSTACNAVNNYWGTTDQTAISQSIRDYSDDYSLGKVTFSPFLTQPSSSAPSAPGVFSEGASFILFASFDYGVEELIFKIAQIVTVALSVSWIVILSVVWVKRRKHKKA
jgi:hypothetical protein